jgi:hypothetical protein
MPFFPDNLPRAFAVADLFCAAAWSDDDLDSDERDQVRKELTVLLGRLPPEVDEHIVRFSRRGFDLMATLTRIHPSGVDEKRALMRGVRAVIKADGALRETEAGFLAQVGHALRVPVNDID